MLKGQGFTPPFKLMKNTCVSPKVDKCDLHYPYCGVPGLSYQTGESNG